MSRELILDIVRVLIAVAAFALTRYIIPAFREWIRGTQLEHVIKWAHQAVLAVEQTCGAYSGPQKKKIVTDFIKRMLIRKNITLSDEELNMLIEAAVKEMNQAEPVISVLSDVEEIKEKEPEAE